MALQDTLLQELRGSLPGAVDDVIKQELYNTVRDMCWEGRVWMETVPVPLTIGLSTYTPAPAGTEIVEAVNVEHDTLDVSNVVFEFGTLTLVSALPTAADVAAGDLYIVAFLSPAFPAPADVENWWPGDLWSVHHAALVAGTKYRMMMHPAKPYSNAAFAAVHYRDYKDRRTEARRAVRLQGKYGAQIWRFPSFSRPWGA